ncbi:MAG: SpoIID/LytB domain-containing protein [Candidatus Zixiibacteriota bacterium]|nr:MAG: SpoIID/LytB domain-containing protein [candidate division Zixibacteria bacterium]
MNPPQLDVAQIQGRASLALRLSQPLTLRSAGREIPLPAGAVSLRLTTSTPCGRETWLWIGNAREEELARMMMELFQASGLSALLWPVGLTPAGSEWRPREFRLLVRPEDERLSLEELEARLRQVQSSLRGVPLEMPQGKPSGQVEVKTEQGEWTLPLPLEFHGSGTVELVDAPVGEGFHWEHVESLPLPAPLWVAAGADGQLCAGVRLEVEDYLASVNSSEMPADSPLEFLKSQVVAARSWLLANWGSHHPGEPFIVCAGDHCQCYYGPDRVQERSREAQASTAGMVLMHEGRVCDARYAKACGGVTEPGANVWPFIEEACLGHFRDLPGGEELDLSKDDAFRDFQGRNHPADACCAPGHAPLEGCLADLTGLYRWEERTTRRELRETIRAKTGVDLGDIDELAALQRGPSGRLIEMEVRGPLGRLGLRPELPIRRALSKTHLPSSAFWVEYDGPEAIILHGLGWGHGVGLCQIGAAALAVRGYTYDRILAHYYRGTELEKAY